MSDDAANEEKAPVAKPAPGLMATLIPAVVVGLVLGGVGFALAYFVLPSRLQASTVTTAATTGTNAVATPAAPAAPAAASGEKTERTSAEVAATGGKAVTKFTIEEVTVNIADTRGNRFVRAGVYFDANPAVLEELETNRALDQDARRTHLARHPRQPAHGTHGYHQPDAEDRPRRQHLFHRPARAVGIS
jgi:flagellar basal body-associated protein FliL